MDFSSKENLSIYPNPSSGNATIQLNKIDSEVNILVYDALGKVVFSQKNVRNEALRIENLKNGLYFVSADTGKQSFDSKLLVY